MKNANLIIIIGVVVLIGGYLLFTQKNEVGTNKITTNNNQSFDLDINSLTYQLPEYSKICLPESRFDCSSGGCERNQPTVFVLYDEDVSKVYRCGNSPCDSYDVTKEVSGLYTNLTPVTPNGSLWKLSEDNQYVETVSIGLGFIIYNGSCTNKK
jgi:hypothetical protein